MEHKLPRIPPPPTIRDLYPALDEAQLREAEETLDRYLEFSLRMYDRIRKDPEGYARFKALTASDIHARIQKEPDSSSV